MRSSIFFKCVYKAVPTSLFPVLRKIPGHKPFSHYSNNSVSKSLYFKLSKHRNCLNFCRHPPKSSKRKFDVRNFSRYDFVSL